MKPLQSAHKKTEHNKQNETANSLYIQISTLLDKMTSSFDETQNISNTFKE